MMSNGKEEGGWPFYGRERELAGMDLILGQSTFTARVVHGRRGVGKTRLLEEAARRHREADGRPTVNCEIPEPRHAGDMAFEDLREAVIGAGQGAALADLPERQSHDNGGIWCRKAVAHLLDRRINVVLDEFHHAAGGLDSHVKQVIDGYHRRTRDPGTGSLVVMGSHQQKLHGLFNRDKPLHKRFGAGAYLRPWSPTTVFEMARDRGLLSRPDRFLALWNAFDGMPDQWRRFNVEEEFEALRDLSGKTQVLFFTHHRHLVDIARQRLGGSFGETILAA